MCSQNELIPMTGRLLPAGILAAVAAVVLASCAPRKDVKEKPVTIPVRVMKAQQTETFSPRRYVGTAAPSRSATVSCGNSGTLVSVNVSRGSHVKKGDIIAVTESQSVLSMAETAEAVLRQAEDGYERARNMHDKGSLADVKMVEIETRLAQARATAKAAARAVEDCIVRAPFDGTVSDVYVEEGMDVSALAPVARIYDMSSMKIIFSVPENEIGSMKVGDAAMVEVPALVGNDSGRAVFRARIAEKGISGSVLSHGYECTLVPSEPCRDLMPGMVCKIRTDREGLEGFVVPASLVRTDASGKYLWGITDSMTVRKIYVTTGGFAAHGVVITSGLANGDLIITEGIRKVSVGMKVKVLEQ